MASKSPLCSPLKISVNKQKIAYLFIIRICIFLIIYWNTIRRRFCVYPIFSGYKRWNEKFKQQAEIMLLNYSFFMAVIFENTFCNWKRTDKNHIGIISGKQKSIWMPEIITIQNHSFLPLQVSMELHSWITLKVAYFSSFINL